LRTDTKLPIFPLSAASDASFTEFQNKLRELKEQADLRDLEAQRRRSF
jgi:hypothetical protein